MVLLLQTFVMFFKRHVEWNELSERINEKLEIDGVTIARINCE